MAGMFDFLTNDDPNAQAQLAMAAGLLGGRGSFNQIASQALMGGTQAGQRAGAIKRQADLDNLAKQRFQLLLDEEQRKKKQFDALEQFRASIPSPEMTSAQMALAGGGGPTQANAAMMPPISQNDRLQFGAMKAGAMSPLDYLNLQRKDTTPIKGSPGDVFFQPGTFKKLAEVPKTDNADPFVRLLVASGIDPASEQGQKLLAQRLQKEATHQEPASINNYAGVQPIDLGGGRTGYIQPPARPGGPSQIVKNPETGQPAVKPNDGSAKDPTEFQSKAGLYFTSMTNASEVANRLETSGRTDWMPSLAEEAAPEKAKNFARSPARQSYVQAQRQWIDSINRVRSGANLPEIEYDRAVKTFFPSFGESDKNVIDQKRAMRAKEEGAMKQAAGRAIKEPKSGWSIERE